MHTSPASAARFVGRIGALAVALGIGAVIGGGPLATADTSADTSTDTSTGSADSRSAGKAAAAPARGSARRAAPVAGGAPREAPVRGSTQRESTTGSAPASRPSAAVPAPVAAVAPRPRTAPTPAITSVAPAPAPAPASAPNPAPAPAPAPAPEPEPNRAPAPEPAARVVAPITATVKPVPAPLPGRAPVGPLQSPVSTALLAAARRLGRADARIVATGPAAAVAAAATTTGTTTTITWAWGTNPVLAFNPATDKLDFGWMQPTAFAVNEVAGSTKIAIVDNNHSYTLSGVPLSALTMTNIVAKDTSTITKWQGLLAGAPAPAAPTVSIANATVAEGNSGSNTAAFTVTLSKAATQTITVGYSTANDTATAGQDYTAASGTLTFAPGVVSQNVTVAVTGDTVVEPTETFTVRLASPSGATLGTATAIGTITNDDTAVVVTPPTVSITNATVAEGNSGTSTLAFTVALSKAATQTVTVGYRTANGTATAGQDYAAASGTLTFAPGVTSQNVTVAVTGDTAVEAAETLTVTLANAAGATLGTATATGTITNDDTATPPPPAVGDRWGSTFYAPYVDMGGWPVPDLVALSTASGATLFTGAFMQATPDGKLAWAGLNALEPGSANEQAQAINRSIKALQDAGGDVMISLGGAAGTSLAQYYQARGMSAQQLADAYAGVVDTYKISHLDFDIEGAAVAEPASITLHSQALQILQRAKPELKIWYTLPVLPTGLTADGINVVDSALKAGVTLAGVNVMAMDYGESAAPTSGPNAKTMGAYAIQAAESTHAQLSTLHSRYGKTYGYNQLGVTPMIGVNDVLSEVFTVADAQALEDYARAKGLGMLSFWSITRDTPGSLGQATPTASGLSAPAGSFSGIFKDYGTQNTFTGNTSGGGTTGGGTTTPVTGGTTTTIGWKWNTNTVLNFDPTKDRLDFVWMGPSYFTIGENAGSTVISIVNNQQTYTLPGVALNRMSTANIIALDPATTAKWQSAISTAGQPTTTPVVTPPTVSVANATVAEGNSGSRNLAFTVSLSKASTTAVSVTYATANGTATAGQDYTAASGTVTFTPGVLSQQVSVTVTGDATVEPNETLTVTLSGPSGASLGTATATGTITNDDSAPAPVTPPAVSVANATVAEGNSGSRNLTFTVSLSKASDAAVTVNYATANGTATAGQDYTAASGTVTFAPGVLSQQVSVTVTGDATVEPNETLTVTLTGPSGASLGTATATGTITNDDSTTPTVPPPATALPIAAHDKVLAAYFPEWGIYGRNFQVADIPGEQLTHVIYSFLNLTPAGDVVLYDSFAAVEKRFAAGETVSGEADQWYYPPSDPRAQQTVWGNFNQLAQLKAKYPHLKVSIAVGGWTLSGDFSTVAATAAGREKMAGSIVSFLTTYKMFDGVDFDWEYPGGGGLDGNSVSPNDGANYAELLKLVRTKLDALEQQTGRQYEISVASPAGYDKIANFNLAGLAPSVDFFNLMSYDFHGTWETTTGHQSAFTGDAGGYDVKTAVGLYLAAGVPVDKIVLGAPLYTRGWSGVADGGDGGYLEKAAGAAPGTFEAGVYDYKDLVAQLKDPASGWKLYWDDTAQAAYLYNASKGLFSSFETPTSIAQKSDWAEAIGLGGMMFWDISNDAIGSPDSLITAAYRSWVLDQTMAAVRAGAPLPGEMVIGGDGVIGALPTALPAGTVL